MAKKKQVIGTIGLDGQWVTEDKQATKVIGSVGIDGTFTSYNNTNSQVANTVNTLNSVQPTVKTQTTVEPTQTINTIGNNGSYFTKGGKLYKENQVLAGQDNGQNIYVFEPEEIKKEKDIYNVVTNPENVIENRNTAKDYKEIRKQQEKDLEKSRKKQAKTYSDEYNNQDERYYNKNGKLYVETKTLAGQDNGKDIYTYNSRELTKDEVEEYKKNKKTYYYLNDKNELKKADNGKKEIEVKPEELESIINDRVLDVSTRFEAAKELNNLTGGKSATYQKYVDDLAKEKYGDANAYQKFSYVCDNLAQGIVNALTGMVDAPVQNFQEGANKASKEESKAKNLVLGYIQTIDQTGITQQPQIYRELKELANNPETTGWSLALNFLMKQLNNNIVSNSIEGIGRMVGAFDKKLENKVKKAREKIEFFQDIGNEDLQDRSYEFVDQTIDGPVPIQVQDVAEGAQVVGNMIPSAIVAEMFPQAAVGPLNAGLVAMGVGAKGQSTKEAEMQGADIGTANDIGNAKMLVEMGTEMATGGLQIFGKGALDDIATRTVDKYISNNIANFLVKKAAGTIGEIGEEVTSDILGWAIDKATTNPDAKFPDLGKTALMTAATTGVMNFGNTMSHGGYNMALQENANSIKMYQLNQKQLEAIAHSDKFLQEVDRRVAEKVTPNMSEEQKAKLAEKEATKLLKQIEKNISDEINILNGESTEESGKIDNPQMTVDNEIDTNANVEEQLDEEKEEKKELKEVELEDIKNDVNAFNLNENTTEDNTVAPYTTETETLLKQISSNDVTRNLEEYAQANNIQNFTEQDIKNYIDQALAEQNLTQEQKSALESKYNDIIMNYLQGQNRLISPEQVKPLAEAGTAPIMAENGVRNESTLELRNNNNKSTLKDSDLVKNENKISNDLEKQYKGFEDISKSKIQESAEALNYDKNAPFKQIEGNYKYEPDDNALVDSARRQVATHFKDNAETRAFVRILEQIIRDKNVEVRFVDRITSKDGQEANGSYGNGIITLKANANEAMDYLLLHELTHAIATKEMINMIKTMREGGLFHSNKNDEFNKQVEKMLKNYDKGVLNEEALATICGEYFKDQNFINMLAEKQPTRFEKIYKQIKFWWHQIRGYKTQNEFIEDLYYKWTQAYKNNFVKRNADSKMSLIGETGLLNLEKTSKDGYDRLSLGLNTAKKMKEKGLDNETIYNKTNWYEDKNGKWKFDVSDASFSIKDNYFVSPNGKYKVKDILTHDELFKIYPDLKDIEVEFKDLEKSAGTYIPKKDKILVKNSLIDDRVKLERTLIHEIQHAIQTREGFEGGSNTLLGRMSYYESLGEIEAKDTENRFEEEKYNHKDLDYAPLTLNKDAKHPNYEKYMQNRKLKDKIKDSIYTKLKEKGKLNNIKSGKQRAFDIAEDNDFRDRAKKEFDVTNNLAEAGYLTTDGSFIDFSGKNQGAQGGRRTLDHRDIGQIYTDAEYKAAENKYPNSGTATAIMQDFIDRGNIRLMPEQGIDISQEPTVEQYDKLYDYIEYLKDTHDEIYIDLETETNNRENLEYSNKTSTSKIINDIKNHYKNNNDINNTTNESNLSKTDNKGRELSEDQQKFYSDNAKETFDDEGRLKHVYHGTANGEFTIFDKSKGNVEGDFGRGFYFTDNENDVEMNYEDGGPDFENKIDKLAERISSEQEISYDEAKDIARAQLYKGGHKFDSYLHLTNPAVVGETMLFNPDDYLEDINSNLADEAEYYTDEIEDFTKEYFDTDDITKLSEADLNEARDEYLREQGIYYDVVDRFFEDSIDTAVNIVENELESSYYNNDLRGILWEAVADGGIGIQELKDKIQENFEFYDENGDLANNEATRLIIESLGYDGIVDKTVSSKFKNMNLDSGTTHYIVFNPNQIKNVDNLHPTENDDIRYSKGNNEFKDYVSKKFTKDSDGNKLNKEQQEYFDDSKALDKKGNLQYVYHGTPHPGFTIFNPSKAKSVFGKYKFGDYDVNYFSASKQTATGYTEIGVEEKTDKGSNVYGGYLNITNPYTVENSSQAIVKSWRNIKDNNIRQYETEYYNDFENKWNKDKNLKNNLNKINEDLFPFNYEVRYNDGYYELYDLGSNDGYGESYKLWVNEDATTKDLFDEGMKDYIYGESFDDYIYTSDKIAKWVLTQNINGDANYDGIIIPDIMDSGPRGSMAGEPTTDYITFKSNQFKYADNLHPTEDDDIRYSMQKESDEFNRYVKSYLKTIPLKEDNDGKKLSKEVIKRNKNSVIRNANGELVRAYHTTTGETLQFNEFNAVGTPGYKYGEDQVNFYTDSKDMSGSYANQSYNMADTRKLKNYDEAVKWIEDNRFKGERAYDYKISDLKAIDGAKRLYLYDFNDGGLLSALDYFTEEEMLKKVKRDIANYSKKPRYKLQYEGYLNITNPFIIDGEGRYWNEVEHESNSFVDSLVNDVKKWEKDELHNLYLESQDRANEIFDKYAKKKMTLDKLLMTGDEDAKRAALVAVRIGIDNVKDLIETNGKNIDSNYEDMIWRAFGDELWNQDFIGRYGEKIDIVRDHKIPERVKTDLTDYLDKEVDLNGYSLKQLLEDFKYLAEENNKTTIDSYFIDEISKEDSKYISPALQEILENRAEMIGNNEVAKELARAAGAKFDKKTLKMLFGTRKTTNDIVKEVLKSNKDGKTNYDGVIFKNILDYGGYSLEDIESPHDVFVTFKSNQFKAVDNENPTDDADIRYSVDDETFREYVRRTFGIESKGLYLEPGNTEVTSEQGNNTPEAETAPESALNEVTEANKFLTPEEQKELDNFLVDESLGWVELTDEEQARMEELKKKAQGYVKKFPELKTKNTFNDIKNIYGKYKESTLSSKDSKLLNEAKNIIQPNKQGRRTMEQWLQVAEHIGSNANVANATDLQKLAIETWFETRPNTKENLNRQSKKYVPFAVTDWVNAVYKGAGVGTDIKLSIDESANKQETNVNAPEVKKEEVLRAPTKIQPDKIKSEREAQKYYEEAGTPEKVAKILSEKPKQTDTSTLRELYQTAKRAIVDKGEAVYRIAKQTKNRRLYAMYDRIGLARGEANSNIGDAQVNLDGDKYTNFIDSTGKNTAMSLNDIWKDVENSGIPESVMNEYLAHYLNVDRYKSNQLTNEEQQELAELNKYKRLSNEQYKRILELQQLEESKNVFGPSVTDADSMQRIQEIESQYPQIKRPAQNIWTYGKNQLDKMVDSGLVSADSREYYNQTTPHYVRLQRDISKPSNPVFDKNGNIRINNQIKAAKGGTQDIIPFKDAMAQYTLDTTSSIRRNLFGNELAKTLQNGFSIDGNYDVDGDIDTGSNKVLSKNDDGSYTFTIFNEGKPEVLTIDKGIYEALQPNKHYEAEKIFLPFKKISDFKRTVLTDKNPLFMATNFFKDFFDAPLNTRHSTVDFLKNYGVAIKEILTNGEYYQKYKALGGSQNTYFDRDGFNPNNLSLKEQYKSIKGVKDALNFGKNAVLSPIEKGNNFIESLPRLSEFITSVKKGESLDEAMYNAAEITTNFKRGGELTKLANRNGATFLNASVQGFDKQIRNFTEIQNPKQAVKLLTKMLVLGVGPALANAIMYDDDEEYEQLPDYVKDSYYLFKTGKDNKWIRIPKGRAISVIQSAARRTYEYSKGDKDAYKGLVSHFNNQLAPNNPFSSNVISPFIDVKNNKSWNGSQIVSDSLKNEAHPEEEYDAKTDELSKWIGKKLGKSPKKINYIIDQNTGAIGDLLLPFLTKQAEGEDDSVAARLLTNPIKDKFTTDAVLNSGAVNDFYEAFNRAQDDKNWSKSTDEDNLKYKYLYSARNDISSINKEIKTIESSNLSDKEKYRQTKALKKEMNDIALDALEDVEDIKIYDSYAQIDDKYYKKEYDKETGGYKYTKVQQKQIDKLKDKNISLVDYFNEQFEKQKKKATQ